MTSEEFDFEKWKRCATGEEYTLRDFFSDEHSDRFASGEFLDKCERMTVTEAIVEVIEEISNLETNSLEASINFDRLAVLLEKCVQLAERGPWRSVYRKEGSAGETLFELPIRKTVAEEATFVTKKCSEFELLSGLDGEPKGLVSHLVLTASQSPEEKADFQALLGRDCCDNAGEFYPCQITECIVTKEFGVKEKAIFINKLPEDQLNARMQHSKRSDGQFSCVQIFSELFTELQQLGLALLSVSRHVHNPAKEVSRDEQPRLNNAK